MKVEPLYEKTNFAYAKTKAQISCAVTAQLISAFAFATYIVQFVYYLNPMFKLLAIFRGCTVYFVQVDNKKKRMKEKQKQNNK